MFRFVCLLLTLLSTQAFAFNQGFIFHRESLAKNKAFIPKTMQTAFFTQKLDHYNENDSRTFKQRYFVDSQYAANASSPVFFIICGEWNCGGTNSYGFAVNMAKKFQAHLVALEHRYYGESLPMNTLSAENLEFLNVSQAMDDMAQFQNFMKSEKGFNGKWIAVGGSYAGSVVAFYRTQYPHMVAGALASSAPVFMKNEFWEYDAHVAKVINQSSCGDKVREAVALIEERMKTPEGVLKVREQFKSLDIKLDDDFIYVVADMLAAAVQYGRHKTFCETLEKDEDLVAAYAEAGVAAIEALGAKPVDISFQAAEKVEAGADDYFRQWMWQSCTEFGWFQVANGTGKDTSRSARVNLKYHADVCQRLFGKELSANSDDHYNYNFYLPLFHADTTRIIFSNGSNDPWLRLSVVEGGEFSNPALTLHMMEGAAHCTDLKAVTNIPAVIAAQVQMTELIRTWLE